MLAELLLIIVIVAWYRERNRRVEAERRLERLRTSVLLINATSGDELMERGG